MKLPLCAGLALWVATATAATHKVTCTTPCIGTTYCRPIVKSDGGTCGTEGVCVEEVKPGGACTGGTATACFTDKCEEKSECQLRKLGGADLTVGICTKTCVVDGVTVYAGWSGPNPDPTLWCQTRRCPADGGELVYDMPLPVCSKVELKCCGPAPSSKSVLKCCGTTRLWVEAKDGKYTCAGVESDDGAAAPFSKACLDSDLKCPGDKPEGWTGQGSDKEADWCKQCHCSAKLFDCEEKECLTAVQLKCCPTPKPAGVQACCGATGTWVKQDATTGMYACAGVVADGSKLPFHTTECAVATGKCKVTAEGVTPEVVIADGAETYHRGADRWCNKCSCTAGKLTCATARCPDLKCCPAAKKSGSEVCCGVDGAWIAPGALCNDATDAKIPPFAAACPPAEEVCEATGVEGAPTGPMAKGETVKKTGSTVKWCDTCTCAANTEGRLAASLERVGVTVTCTSVTACPPLKCCPPPSTGTTTGLVCCGTTGTWEKEVAGKAKCAGGVGIFTVSDGLPFAKVCKSCTFENAQVKPTGWAGFNFGAEWCNKCSCTGDGDKTCTSLDCTTRLQCCADPKPSSGTPKCCGATGLWVQPDTAGAYTCGVVTLTTGLPLHDDACKTCADGAKVGEVTKHVNAEDWCKTCTCEGATPLAKCPTTPTCPVKADLKCCREADKGSNDVCCGVTGLWQKVADACAGVTLTTPPAAGAAVAPFNDACTRCDVDGTQVEVGWRGYVPGPNWCTLAYCTVKGLVYRAAGSCTELCCPPPAPPGQQCCGATGGWVTVTGGKASCGPGSMNTAALPVQAPTAVCNECTFTNNGGVTHPVGWFGSIACNVCYCAPGTPPTPLCTSFVCP